MQQIEADNSDAPYPAPDGTRWTTVNAYDEDGTVVRLNHLQTIHTRPRARRYSDPFVAVFGWDRLADADLTASQAKLFFVVMAASSHDGEPWDATPERLMPLLGWDKSRVSRELKNLADKGVITRPRRGTAMFHPLVSWQGTPDERERAKRLLEDAE